MEKQNIKKFIEAEYRNELPYLLKYLGLDGDGIEIGVQRGEYSRYILERSNLRMLYLCDPWRHLENGYEPTGNCSDELWQNDLDAVIKKLAGFENRYTILRKTSREAAAEFADESFDFVYIDADHRYEYAKEDIAKWFPKVKKGGVFSGHDYFDPKDIPDLSLEYFGVKKAVDEFFGKDNFFVTKEVFTIKTQLAPSWYCLKQK